MSSAPCCTFDLLEVRPGPWRWHVHTKRNIVAGQVLSRSLPLSHFMTATDSCRWCAGTESSSRCSSCKYARYCGRSCQAQDFVQHKRECRFLKQLNSMNVPREDVDQVCLLLRTQGALAKLKKRKQADCCCKDRGIIQCGFQHWEQMARSTLAAQASPFVKRTMEEFDSSMNVQDALSIFAANNFGILSNVLQETIGQGVYPHAALLNHSCDPNVLLRFDGRTLVLVAMHDIQEGDEVMHSFIDLVASDRHEKLQQLHGFTCTCARCRGEILISLPKTVPANHNELYQWILQNYRDKTSLPNDGTIVEMPIDEALDSYGVPSTVNMVKVDKLMETASGHLQNNDSEGELGVLRCAVDALSRECSPLSRTLYQVRGRYLSTLLVTGNYNEAKETCLAMVAFLIVALPPNHPILGLQLFTLGDLTENETYYNWAREILTISHGPDHDLVARLNSA